MYESVKLMGGGLAAQYAGVLVSLGMAWACALCVGAIRGRRIYAPLWVAPAALMFIAVGYGYSYDYEAAIRAYSSRAAADIFRNPKLFFYRWEEIGLLREVAALAARGLLAGAWLASWSALCLGFATFWRGGVRATPRDVLPALGVSLCAVGLCAAGLGGLWGYAGWVYLVPAPAVVGVLLANLRRGRDGAPGGERALVALGLLGAVGGVMLARPGLWLKAAPMLLRGATAQDALVALDARFAAALMPGATAVLVAGAGVGLALDRLERREAVGGVIVVCVLCVCAAVVPWRAEQARAGYIRTFQENLPVGLTPPQLTRWTALNGLKSTLILRDGGSGPQLVGRSATDWMPKVCKGPTLPEGCQFDTTDVYVLVALNGSAPSEPLRTLCKGVSRELNVLVGETLERRLDVLTGMEPGVMSMVPLHCSGTSQWRPGHRLGTLVPEGYVDSSDDEISILVRRDDVLWWGKRVEAQEIPHSIESMVGVVVEPWMTWQEVLRRCERFAATPKRCIALVDDDPPTQDGGEHEQIRRMLWGRDVQRSDNGAAQDVDDSAGLPPEAIKRGVEAGVPGFKICIAGMRERRLKEEEHQEIKRYARLESTGVVNMRFTITEQGAASAVELNYHVYGEDGQFERCMRRVFQELEFPKPLKGPMTVTHTLPLRM